MTTPSKAPSLVDAGEYVPYAKKHNAELRGKQGQDCLLLSDIWPQPDWIRLVKNGMSEELAAAKFIAYNCLRNKPRAAWTRDISGEDWLAAYKTAVTMVRGIVESASAADQLTNIDLLLLEKLQLKKEDVRSRSVAENIIFWAAGMGGDRTLKSIDSATLRLRQMKKWLARMGWPHSESAWKTSIVPVKLTSGTWRISRVDGKQWVILSEVVYSDEKEVLQAAIKMADKEVAEK